MQDSTDTIEQNSWSSEVQPVCSMGIKLLLFRSWDYHSDVTY